MSIEFINKCINQSTKKFILYPRIFISSILKTTGYLIFYAGGTDYSRQSLNKVLYNNTIHRYFFYFLIATFISSFLMVVLGPFLLNGPTTFNVTAVTEEVKVVTQKVPMSSWPVENIQLSTDCPDEKRDVKYPHFTGSIKLNPSVQIIFTRIAFGKLAVKMFNNKNKSVGDLYNEEDDYVESLTKCAYFHVGNINKNAKSGKTILLPITGNITVGNGARFLSKTNNSVLREGKVTILARSFILNEFYSLEPNKLETGDQFEIQHTSVPSQGFILVNEKAAINLVYSAKGYRGVIKRYQAEDLELKNSYWSKLYHDEALSLSWILIIILFNIIRIYLQFLVNESEKNNY